MGYPRKVESLWSEADYTHAIDALMEEWKRFRERYGDLDNVNAIYRREADRLVSARLRLAARGTS